MRPLRIGLLAAVLVPFVAYAAHGRAAVRAAGRCAVRPGLVAPRLPVPIVARTSCGAFRIAVDGGITRFSSHPRPVPADAAWWRTNGVWIDTARGHVVVGRWGRTLWRSAGRFRSAGVTGELALTGNRLAFSYGNRVPRLYVAPLDGRERPVARGEFPLGGTGGGFYTRRVHGAELRLRSRTGRLLGTIARNVHSYAYDPRARSLLFVAGDRLVRAQGARVRPLAGLARLGLRPGRSLQILPLGRLVGLETGGRLVVLRPDGSFFASTTLPFSRKRIEFVSGPPTAAPGGAAVAFAGIRGDRAGDGRVMQRGVETVYLLQSGAHAAVPVHAARTWFDVCGHAADLSWHGDWLLYGATGGSTALVDRNSGRTIGLSSIVRRLPGFEADGTTYFDIAFR